MNMDQHYVVAVSHIDIAYIEREEASEEMLESCWSGCCP